MLNIIPVAAATAVLGYNLLANRPDVSVSQRARVIRGIGVTGSAAIGDAKVAVKVGNTVVANLPNTATGYPTADASTWATYFAVPAGAPILVEVTDAPATNSLNLLIDV